MDIAKAKEILEVVLYSEIFKILLAIIIGMFVGRERGKASRPAGARTHAIVCIAATVVMIIGIKMSASYNTDPTRMAAQVISGIGFLGAGTILKNGFSVRGLTTAATIWGVGCIGLAVGAGYYVVALVATAGMYYALRGMSNVGKKPIKGIMIALDKLDGEVLDSITDIIEHCGGFVDTVTFEKQLNVQFTVRMDSDTEKTVIAALYSLPHVVNVHSS